MLNSHGGIRMECDVILQILNHEKEELEEELTKVKNNYECHKIGTEYLCYYTNLLHLRLKIIDKIYAYFLAKINNFSLIEDSYLKEEKPLDSSLILLSDAAKNYDTMVSMSALLTAYYDAKEYIDEVKKKKDLISLKDYEETINSLQKNETDYFEEMCSLVGHDSKATLVPASATSFDENFQIIMNAYCLEYEQKLKEKIKVILSKNKKDSYKREKKTNY